ncbi:hypothetical protein C8J56DRAFT_1006285 [Mycena floridula]|nr:hypothetical protein C8J56DRAFT_1006285 [Mycena floridula]
MSSSASKITRTYSRQKRAIIPPSSPPSTLSSSPAASPSRKRPLERAQSSLDNIPPAPKRLKTSSSLTKKPKQKTLTQLHFCIDQPIVRTCPLCSLTYIRGAPDDESLHKSHCSRVQKGLEWGKEEEKEAKRASLTVIATGVELKDGRKGRIIRVEGDSGGKIGTKLTTLLETINLALSSPPLTPAILKASKFYLLLLPSPKMSKETIAGCVIAQYITTAMAIATIDDDGPSSSPPTATLVTVDASTGLFCYPKALPTPLGIPRLFVPSTHRRLGIASQLLSAAARTFIHGCPLDPKKGQVAFTQPTGDGNALMNSWGKGGVRIYEE